ncbi:hypothetical protein J2S00_002783 [Caldalkalibacillus uzonensis]|uniref:DUF3906 family protein n=1 Tax=Caldalkalibacillus uzonensis TaxID=353224 RepID=A0ABU0CU86_9BACI|nr:DUF3906 family protein [Caldalkalibacillus uzonensis]MDQ0339988.1 hypothetical protein [Caldalkalibacillus uzonensis]
MSAEYYLYRLEMKVDGQPVEVIVAAENHERAFAIAEIEVEKMYLRLPQLEEMAIVEKKKIGRGSGYVVADGRNQ